MCFGGFENIFDAFFKLVAFSIFLFVSFICALMKLVNILNILMLLKGQLFVLIG